MLLPKPNKLIKKNQKFYYINIRFASPNYRYFCNIGRMSNDSSSSSKTLSKKLNIRIRTITSYIGSKILSNEIDFKI